MHNRSALAKKFLSNANWADAIRAPLAGDASNRKYERLTDSKTGKSAVLMDAAPELGEDVRPFIRVGKYLRQAGLSAPEIMADDPTNGFLLLEDLGNDLFARLIRRRPELEVTLYEAATDVLVHLHGKDSGNLAAYNDVLMVDLASLALSKYRQGILGTDDSNLETQFRNQFQEVLRQIDSSDPVLIQRDYHAENLIWLPERQGVARVGLLDFQDAMSGHRAYDLVSLLQDARRDVPVEIENAMIQRYTQKTQQNPTEFRSAYAVLGTQRNLRILGVFARLGKDFGKPGYVDLIPRVWNYLMRDLEHPSLRFIAPLIKNALPEPTESNLEKLKTA